MLTKIRKLGDPVLTIQAHPILLHKEKPLDLIGMMFDVMYEAGGVGLAANQVGVTKSLFVYDDMQGNKGYVANPRYWSEDQKVIDIDEGCLSVPGRHHPTPRFETISMIGTTDINGTVSEWTNVGGLLGQIFQHETDHLNGKLYITKLPKETQMAIVLANQVI